MERGILDIKINHEIWPTKNFTYTAQSLYKIINNTHKFASSSQVTGYCRGQPGNKTQVSDPIYNGDFTVEVWFNC